MLADVDVLVIPHCSDEEWETTTGVGTPVHTPDELAAIEGFVAAGGGLMVLAETEQKKYGNVLGDLAARFGIDVVSTTVQDPVHRFKDVSTWVLGQPGPKTEHDLLAEVSRACFYRAGVLRLTSPEAFPVLVTSPDATVAGAPLIAAVPAGAGRVVVAADSDLFGDDSIADLEHRRLWLNLVTWAGTGRAGTAASVEDAAGALQDPAWDALVAAIEELRPLQAKDGSVGDEHRERAAELVADIAEAVTALSPRFPHQQAHLDATVTDLMAWRDAGLGVPDFLDSLLLFHPEQERRDGVEHLAVFPMYTQNGNPNRNVEAVVIRTVWPDWIAHLEAGDYDNPAFVPIEFVGFTRGTTPTPQCCSRRRWRPARPPASHGAASSATVRPPASDVSRPRRPTCSSYRCRRTLSGCWPTSDWRRRRSSCGTSSTTARTATGTCHSTRS